MTIYLLQLCHIVSHSESFTFKNVIPRVNRSGFASQRILSSFLTRVNNSVCDAICCEIGCCPGILKIKASGDTVDVENLAGKKEIFNQTAFKSFEIH